MGGIQGWHIVILLVVVVVVATIVLVVLFAKKLSQRVGADRIDGEHRP